MNDKPPTIWVVNEAGHDYTAALELIPGSSISYLSQGNINPLFFDRMVDNFATGIARYVAKEDYLLIAGTPPANAVCYLLWIMLFEECKALLWDAKQSKYKIVKLTLDHVRGTLQKHLER